MSDISVNEGSLIEGLSEAPLSLSRRFRDQNPTFLAEMRRLVQKKAGVPSDTPENDWHARFSDGIDWLRSLPPSNDADYDHTPALDEAA